MKRIFTKQLSRNALRLADGVFGYAVDLGLWMTIYFAEMSLPQSASGQLWRSRIAADKFVSQMNYEVIKNAIQTARKRGWITMSKRRAMPEITDEGKKRLAEVLPHYDLKRAWDGKMHIITYDIPEEHKKNRELLRRYLQKIRCGRLQDSVWITPYNPIDLVRLFSQEKEIHGTIIVSDMGRDGSIGEEDLKSLIVRVFDLVSLDKRYEQWLEEIEDFEGIDFSAMLSYLAILKDDPQLPFHLLPKWWKGEKAYQLIKSEFSKVVDRYAIA